MKAAIKERLRSLLSMMGIQVEPGQRWAWRLTPRFFALAGGCAVSFIVANLGLIRYSESPRFCNSCHIMEPYYKAWKGSPHKDVACVECHYPPVENMSGLKKVLFKKYQNLSQVAKYVTRTYSSKPFAEVEDASCLRSGCHSKRLLEGEVRIRGGLVKFDHRPHLTEVRRGRQLRCVSCHSQVVMGRHIEVTYETCWLCHFKDRGAGRDLKPVAGCTGCHEVPSKPIKIGNMTYDHREYVTRRGLSCLNCHMDVVSGRGDAPKDRCFACHNQPEKLDKYGDMPFLHEKHVTKKGVACFHCHTEMRHGFALGAAAPEEAAAHAAAPPAKMRDCALCHSGKHDAPLAMFSGTAARRFGLPDLPSPMFLAHVDCAGCHYEATTKADDPRGSTTKASPAACVKCHGERFRGVFEEAQAEVAETLAKLGAKEAVLGPSRPKAAADRLRFLRAARGEHNVYLAASALAKVDAELDAAASASGKKVEDLSALPLISGSFCATMCHQKVGVKVPPETVTFKGKTMPHAMHVETVGGCRKCHDIAGHKRVPLKAGVEKDVCAGCHAP